MSEAKMKSLKFTGRSGGMTFNVFENCVLAEASATFKCNRGVFDLAKVMKKLGFCDLLPSHKTLVEFLESNMQEFQQLGVNVDGCLDELRSAKVSFSRFGKEERWKTELQEFLVDATGTSLCK
jgi:hypothetical protein